MNMFEEAEALRTMIGMCSVSQSEMAKKLGVSQSYISNKLRLLSFGEEAKAAILKAGLSERHARTLLRLVDSEKLAFAIEKTAKEHLSVERCEALVEFLYNSEAPERIGRKDRLLGIESFKDAIKRSTDALSSLGVEAKRSVSYYGTKTYITISIEEG